MGGGGGGVVGGGGGGVLGWVVYNVNIIRRKVSVQNSRLKMFIRTGKWRFVYVCCVEEPALVPLIKNVYISAVLRLFC